MKLLTQQITPSITTNIEYPNSNCPEGVNLLGGITLLVLSLFITFIVLVTISRLNKNIIKIRIAKYLKLTVIVLLSLVIFPYTFKLLQLLNKDYRFLPDFMFMQCL